MRRLLGRIKKGHADTLCDLSLFSTPDRGRRAPSNVEVMRAPVHDDGEIEAVVERLAAAPNSALLVPSDTFTWFRSSMIVALAAKNWLPAIYFI